MRKGLLLLTAILIAVAMPMSLAAQEKEIEVEVKVCEETCKGEHGCKTEIKKCGTKAKIDPIVKLKLEKLQIELKLENYGLELKKKEIHKKMHEEYMSEKPSRKTLDKLGSKLLDIDAKLLANKHDYMFKALELATADQIMMFHKCHGAKGCGDKGHGGKCCGSCSSHGKCSTSKCSTSKCGNTWTHKAPKCGTSCKSKGCAHGEKMIWIEKDGDAPHAEHIIKHIEGVDGDAKVIMIKCDELGCGHKDKSECTDECLKKHIKIIEKKIKEETEKE